MEEPEKGLSTSGTSELAGDVKVGGETLEGSVECGGQVQVEELVGEGGDCNGKDVTVEGMGSDVCTYGVCNNESGSEANAEVGRGDSVDVVEDLGKDVKSAGVSSGAEVRFEDSRVVESDETKRENAAVELDGAVLEREVRDQVVVGSDECNVASLKDEAVLNDRVQKEVGTGVSDSPGNIEVLVKEDLGVDCIKATDAEVPTDAGCDDALGCSLTGSSVGGENVQCRRDEKENQKDGNAIDHGTPNDGNDVTLEALDEQKSTDNLQSEEMLDKEACISDKVEVDEKLSSNGEQPIGKDQGNDNSNKMVNDSVEIKGTSVSLGSKKNVDANATAEKDTQVIDQGNLVTFGDEKEKFNDESNAKKNVEEQAGISKQVDSNEGQEIEESNKAEQRKPTDKKALKRGLMKRGSSEVFVQTRYSLRTEKKYEFSVSDMVWGKVRSHPWWPGQIFDPADASEKAMKHRKKGSHLVAYFGDRTFAWNEASQLKPFRTHFSSIEKQSTSESFHNAVDCALEEVTRRVEFGLACSCIPKVTYDAIKFQTVENTGIREELRFRDGVDESLNASSFSPTKLVEYLKTLSELTTGGFDRLEFVIAKAQLLAFNRFKGFSCLPEIQNCGDLVNDTDISFHDDEKKSSEDEHATPVVKNDGQDGLGNLTKEGNSRHKRKYNVMDTMHSTKKKRLSELMGGTPDSPDVDRWSDEKVTDMVSTRRSKKRKAIDPYADASGKQDGRKTTSLAKASNTAKSSFKIGDCIRRAASELTGSPSIFKCSSDRSQKTDGDIDGFEPPSMLKCSSDQSQKTDGDIDGFLSPSPVKCSSDRSQKTDVDIDDITGNGSDVSLPTLEEETQRSSMTADAPTEYSSLDDLLSSLHWVAQEPLGEYSFLKATVSFFSDFRNSIIVTIDSAKEIMDHKIGTMDRVGTKRKRPPFAGSPVGTMDNVGIKRKKPPIVGSPETFEFEDRKDTYWTDRVIDNGNEEQPVEAVQQAQPSQRNQIEDDQLGPAEQRKPVKVRKSYTKKQYSDSNHSEAPEKPPGYIDENAPAELVMNFAELDSVPSVTNLNRTFKRFGPLKESETEVDTVSSRARVVFKKCMDAEVAYSSVKKFNIFGSVPVNYQLNYTPSALFKAPATAQDQDIHLDLSDLEINML